MVPNKTIINICLFLLLMHCVQLGFMTFGKSSLVYMFKFAFTFIFTFTFMFTYIYTFEGIDNNETIKVYRSGGADPEGDRPGDLYVTIKVKKKKNLVIDKVISPFLLYLITTPIIFSSFIFMQVREDPVFRREGSDIHVDTVLSITQVMFPNEEILDSLACAGPNFHDCFCSNFLFWGP